MILDLPVKFWSCPSCGISERVQQAGVYTRMHPCPAVGGVTVPLVEVATLDAKPDAVHRIVEREDYIGDSSASRVAAIRTDHGDGSNDCTVLAPTARVKFVYE